MKPLEPQAEKESIRHRKVYRNWTSCCHRFSKKGQSIAHIYASHADEIACSRRTIYSYIDRGVFQARNIDLRRKVVYKQTEKEKLLPALKTEVSEKIGAIKNFWNISQRTNLFM